MKGFEGYRVLLADDEEIDLEIVANIVNDLGAECIKVRDGEEMLKILNGPEGSKIDLVLTDINMPGKSGIDACSEFRASSHPKARTLPIIGISADTDHMLFDKAISAGMNSMTTKPLTRETLLSHFHITLKDNRANAVFSERIQQALAKSLFFSSVSHDIRTPLNAIIGFSEMLKQGFETKAEYDLAVNSILVSSKMLLQLVNDILDLSKLESGKMNIETEPTDVARLVREIAASFGATHQKPGLEILCRAGGTPSLMIDPHRLRQIVFNFVGNAIKFTKRGFIEIRTSFTPDAGGKTGVFRLEVEDTGCGISEADMKKLARPFVQVGIASGQRGGTGLGLHICRMLARAMGGEMEMKSVLGKGATFSIVVPRVRVVGSEVGENSWSSRKDEKHHSPTQDSNSNFLRILVVDDTKMNQIVLKAMFGRLGVKDIAFADNGREALEVLTAPDAPKFDFVLTDAWMPEMTGMELVSSIRANAALARLRVYLFTAEVEMKDTYAEKGFDGILLKPANLDALKKLLP
ncbi:MAG: response regulator [Kiritimatiellae bacterium]|nr:response regulator [Kiritimatiellia bacterium]